MQTPSGWHEAWQLPHTSRLPGSPAASRSSVAAQGDSEDTVEQGERQGGQLIPPAPDRSPARRDLLPAHPLWDTVTTTARLSADIHYPLTQKTRPEENNFFKLS